jgi:hypothetical protein
MMRRARIVACKRAMPTRGIVLGVDEETAIRTRAAKMNAARNMTAPVREALELRGSTHIHMPIAQDGKVLYQAHAHAITIIALTARTKARIRSDL